MEHPDIRNKYVDYYNRTYNNTRLRQYDGSHLAFPGMSPAIQLREHQVMQLQEFYTVIQMLYLLIQLVREKHMK